MTLWTVAGQVPLSMGLSRQEYWSGLPCSPPGSLSNSWIEPASPVSPALQADSLPADLPGKPQYYTVHQFSLAKLNILNPFNLRRGKTEKYSQSCQ